PAARLLAAAAAADPTRPLAITRRVTIEGGRSVTVHAFGFDGTPVGTILATDEPGHPTTASGQLDLKHGTFTAYGRKLTIERGRLFFAGPVTDPALDLSAIRKANDGTVAVLQVRGTAAAPDMTVTSRPAKPQR